MSLRRAIILVAIALAPSRLLAQVGATTDIITGKVSGPGGAPIVGARVEITSIELDVTRSRTTNEKGQYTILFPDGGGQYRVTVRAIGMAPSTITVVRQADEDRLIGDVTLSANVQRLQTATIQANNNPGNNNDRPTPGSTERAFTAEQLFRLPVDPTDPVAVAGLAAGVVTLGGTDSTSSSFSVAGQRADQNQITLDGLSLGTGSVPSEAVRSTRVITNTYDVARGQFTGGQVSSTTRSGTNVIQGSFGYLANEPGLEFPDSASAQFGQKYTQNRLSFGVGGPFKKDEMFWFGSLQWTGRQTGLQSLVSANEAILQRNNASPDSVSKFIADIQNFHIPVSTGSVPLTSNHDGVTGLTRLDFTLGDNHTATIRGDWNWSSQDANRITALSLPAHGGSLGSAGGGVMLSLSSQWDNGVINQGQIYGQKRNNDTDPFLKYPQGSVRVTSLLEDGTTAVSNLSFGGNASMPTNSLQNMVEFSDEASYLSSQHRVKLGTLLNVTGNDNDNATNRNGSFSFNSLNDFQNGTPAQYTRLLTPNRQAGDAINAAVYLGDTYRRSRGLQLVYGVRLEGSRYDGRPTYNAKVDSSFGRRTDFFPSEVHLSPRIGFTWTSVPPNQQRRPGDTTQANGRGGDGGGRGGAGGGGGGRGGFGGGRGGGGGGLAGAMAGFSQTVIRGGIGEFRGRAPTQLFSSAINANGLANGETQLVCVGPAAPIPNWSQYLADPTSIPSACADGTTGGSTFSSSARNVTTFSPEFTVPRTWRASLGGQHRLFDRYTVSLDLTYALGTHLYGVTDMNLNTAAPRFTLSGESNRPVYVNPAAIVTTTGAVNSLDSRRIAGFGSVYDVTSDLKSDARQASISISGFTPQGIQLAASYTYLRSIDQSSSSGGSVNGLFSGPTTSGDPNVLQWATSDNERRHQVILTANWPIHPSVEITGVARLVSGQPYTPRVGSDINGDGARNDRAFIYNPLSAPDTALANGMTRLLGEAPAATRQCLQSQMGRIADRNSCTAPWYPSLDFQVNYRPDRFGLKRNLMLSFSFNNPLAGADQLLHGSSNLQGWGQAPRVDPNLLFVRGFDANSQRFIYQVNERFGSSRGSTTLTNPNPFNIAITARLTVGPDRGRDALLAMQNAARGGRGNQFADSAGGNVGAQVRRYAPNVFRQILQQKDSLKLNLTDIQVAKLTQMQDSLFQKVDTLAVHLLDKMNAMGNNADQAAVQVQIRPILVEAQQLGATSNHQAQIILTKEQWDKLPDRIKNPQSVFGPGPGAGGRGGRGGPPPRH